MPKSPDPDFIERHRTPIGLALVALIISGSIVSLYSINVQNKTPEMSLVKTSNVNKEEQTNTSNVADGSFDVEKNKIHVGGAVNSPGVVELNRGLRIEDALNAAGGLSDAADTSYIDKNINLAKKLSDGDKIYIPAQGETLSAGTTEKTSKTGAININTAGIEELVAANLYRIGYKTAGKIVEYRERTGSFSDVVEIMEVSGIGEKTFERIKERIRVE